MSQRALLLLLDVVAGIAFLAAIAVFVIAVVP